MLKAVFDTNIIISAFIFPNGIPAKMYMLAIRRKFRLCSSPAIMTEVAEKLRTKFYVSDEDTIDLLKQIARVSEIIKPKNRITLIDDEPDNRILECAVELNADLIVSGDGHLLKHNEFQGIRIIRAADFLRTFPK